jgi:hypothetical protein
VPKRDTRRDHYIKFVDLGLEGCSEDYNADALRQAPIIGHRSLGDLFGYRIDGNPHSSIKLGEVIKRSDADADEHDWVHDVARAIAAAASSKKPDPVEACFRGRDQRLYRPTLHSLDRYADTNKPKSAHIVFQAVPRPTTGSAPR